MPVSTECAAALLSFRYPSIFPLNPDYVAARSLRSLRSKHIFHMLLYKSSWWSFWYKTCRQGLHAWKLKFILDHKSNSKYYTGLKIGHLYNGVIVLLQPESFRVLLSCANNGFCYLNLTGTTKFKYGRKNKMNSSVSCKNTSSCKE